MVYVASTEDTVNNSQTNEINSNNPEREISLRVSIVCYYIDDDILELLESFKKAASYIDHLRYDFVIVENGYKELKPLHNKVVDQFQFCEIIISGENLGYGRGHNVTFSEDYDYHLILNPDVIFTDDSLSNALVFMEKNKGCGLLSPQAFWRNGDRQYLCKRYPNVFTLFLRAFLPKSLHHLFKNKLETYCMMKETQSETVLWQPDSVSGCFMFFRNNVLLQLNGFDKNFFLYFEDTDLSLRARQVTEVAYVPDVKIIHHGGNVSRKGLKHILLFSHSMFKFFNKHGWKFF
ncbi:MULTISPECIES: glycosyltransferase family 2 protein [Pantoea]|uniref:glycosyltransferase family 2 protein n=2 Tax=Erwiniaceae TaxID=1903409 RepID=UPI000DAE4FAB|nr:MULTISPECIES: glycosyltransferase family 2 protein [Pantoea]MBD8115702.1 glycosyltransferase family 2 protein [Pantoea agglomerans]RAH34324.1 glycosyltransferase family 2 protein [Pantoea agglomerans]TGX94540.1 glycosyltransferase family 2 protein [Pantoea agglomerans]WNK59295.1 glycosyltransferase family 2 protein [Pantoea agglomerans]